MKRRAVILLCLSLVLLSACAIRKNPTIFVDVYHSIYQPKFDPAAFADYKGKAIVFDSIRNEAGNTTMLGYYSWDRNVRYTMNYAVGRMSQPMESFLWYALQKAFAHAGITATNENLPDKLDLHLTVLSLDDREAKLQMQVFRAGKTVVQKTITATQNLPPTTDVSELENRTYKYIDILAVAVLSDPDFKKELLMQ